MSGWIKATERLPDGNRQLYEGCLESSSTVLVYGLDYEGKKAYGIAEYIRDYANPQDSGWCGYMHDGWDLEHCNVTHWMLMPEPPKEDDKP